MKTVELIDKCSQNTGKGHEHAIHLEKGEIQVALETT